MPAAVLVPVTGVLGLVVGVGLRRAFLRFPWVGRAGLPGPPVGERAARRADRGGAVVLLGTAGAFTATAWRFGWSAELPAFLVLAAAAVLLAAIDLRHSVLPDRVVLPALVAGAVLLAGAAATDGSWGAWGRAGLGAVVLFAVFLVLALLSPRSLGMGDVKLAALLGLHLGWLGWPVLVVGAAAGFVVQAGAALVLLALRRVAWKGELPFGPAMLAGAAAAALATPLLL